MNTFLTILCLLAVMVGIFLIVQFLRSKTYAGDADKLEYKDGLPILPRDKRDEATPAVPAPDIVPDEPMQSVDIDLGETPKSARERAEEAKADALSSLAMVASQNPSEPSGELPNELPKYTVYQEVEEHQGFTHHTPESAQAEYDKVESVLVSPQPEPEVEVDNTPAEKFAEVSNDFTQNSPMLDRHLIEQQTFDQNNDPLLNAQDTVTIVITPRNQYVGLSGKEVLNIVRNYGLKYGVMNMYHRYEREDGMGDLWFSMMGVDYNGVQVFDLNTLPDAHFTGLSLFLSLPHPHALRGFESMVSTARMIAKDLNADIHDEEGYLLDDAYIEKIRLQVADYTT